MRAKLLTALIVGAVASTIISISAVADPVTPMAPMAAGRYMCPLPSQINCVPAVTPIGAWQANGGQMTGNTFMPNSQCANVITLSPDKQRLLCCYQKCGVFIQDVPAKHCTKLNQSAFSCQ